MRGLSGPAEPVDWAGWKDNGCIPVLGKAACWHGVGGRDMDMSLILMDAPSGWLQAMGGEVGFLWLVPDSRPILRGNLSENGGSWMGWLKGQSGRRNLPPRTHSRPRDRPRLEFATWKTACFRELRILAFEPFSSL